MTSGSDVLADRVGSLYAQLPASLLGQALGVVVIGVLFLVLPGPQVLGVVSGWLLLAVLAWGWRWRLHRLHQTQPAPQVADWTGWRRRWELSTLLCSGVWSLAMLWFYPLGTELQRAGLIALLACLCIGSAAAGHRTTLVGIALMALATSWQFFTTAAATPWANTLGLAGAFLGVALVGHHQRQCYTRLLLYKQRSERLAAQLAAEKDVAEEARLDAEAATRARTQFFIAASHDLRQPLHALVLFTESLRLRNRDTALEPTIASIGESVDALEALFDKLLDLTSIDSSAIVVEPKLFHMRELYARLKLHFEPQAFDKGLGLDFVGGRHAVRTDPLLVERILRNLVSNAIRYTADGGLLVSCRTRGDRLLLQVWDTGVGIDARLLPSIFDEFYQVSTASGPDQSPRKGLGLGLAIVRRLSELLQAPLGVRSRPGHGTVFSLLLPPMTTPPTDEELTVPMGMTPTWSSPTLAGRHVVVVGADLDAGADGLGAMLQAWGAQVSAFSNAATVLDWSTSQGRLPDLVVVGRTPAHERGGVDLVRALRLVFGVALPAVLLSDGEGDAAAATEPGVHLLARPVAPNRLRAMVNFKLSARTISHPDL
ncbi:ATP-binding protein [Sphaerotilus sp.]|uniref:ATP-binding protein n=1 Tax=Sphaerotilus sp. TaxID=2093942 RepID=UPI00286E83CB|nr:ATP-binding protein [Sphaerotilus sp.]